MAPPPATPTPHRFLVPRRSQPIKQETPNGFQSGGQQFQATPRFAVHSTPRPSGSHLPSSSAAAAVRTPASTSGVASVGAVAFFRPTPRNTDPINDIVSSSPPFSEQQGRRDGGSGKQHDPIDISFNDTDENSDEDNEDAVPESSPIRRRSNDRDESSIYEEEYDDEDGMRSRSPKRRRISISSDIDLDTAASPHQQHYKNEEDANTDQDTDMIQSSPPSPFPLSPLHPTQANPGDASPPPSTPTSTDSDHSSIPQPQPTHQKQTPIFQNPPRFKPSNIEETTTSPSSRQYYNDPLPDAFSPHRRKGAKYIPGGLAASVRDWFVDVWAGVKYDTAGGGDGWVAKIRVEEVEVGGGGGMRLVWGWYLRDGDHDGNGEGEGDGELEHVKVVLTGSPRVSGLAKRDEVRQGSVLGIGRPTWDVVVLGQGLWGVVCEWAVLQ